MTVKCCLCLLQWMVKVLKETVMNDIKKKLKDGGVEKEVKEEIDKLLLANI